MASSPKKRQAPKLTKNQRELKVLKEAGLWSGDYRKAKVASGAQKRLRKQYAADIPLLASGKAQSVKVGSSRGKEFPADMRPHNGRVVVKVDKRGERFRYDARRGRITSTVERYGIKYRRIIPTRDVHDLKDLPRGKNLSYLVPFKQWGLESPKFTSPEELAAFMNGYEARFPNWLDYVEILEPINARARRQDAATLDDDGGAEQ